MMMKKILLAILLLSSAALRAQTVGVKTNIVGDALSNVTLGAEVAVAPQWTLEAYGSYNGWTLSHGRHWKHFLFQPAARYWLCEKFSGHFFGLHAHTGKFNVGGFDGRFNWLGTNMHKIAHDRYQGWLLGLGVSYGYAFVLSRHWNAEAEIGLGWAYTKFDRFDCHNCSRLEDRGKHHNYVGPTKAALNLVYVF